MYFLIILSISVLLTGKCDAEVSLICTGCTQPPNEADYYCPGETQFLYFFCEVTNSAQLTWEIPQLISQSIDFSATTLSEDNIIDIGPVTAILGEKETNGGEIGNFSSHLWIDFRNVTSIEINITCISSLETSYKELLPLESAFSPNETFAVAYILDPRIDVPTVYYSWNHPFPEQVFVYETEVYENGTLIHRMNVPPNIMNATCQLNSNKTMCEDCYLVEVTAVNRCNQRRMNTTNIETRENDIPTRTVTVDEECKLIASLSGFFAFVVGIIITILIIICMYKKKIWPF